MDSSISHQAVDKDFALAEETLIIRNSGEIPEVTYHSSLYYLTKDPDGPGLCLAISDLRVLQEAVLARYRTIILRDLTCDNRDRSLYRGLKRCVANWQRLTLFAAREGWDIELLRAEVRDALRFFMAQEQDDIKSGRRQTCINCGADELAWLAREVGCAADLLEKGWQELCG